MKKLLIILIILQCPILLGMELEHPQPRLPIDALMRQQLANFSQTTISAAPVVTERQKPIDSAALQQRIVQIDKELKKAKKQRKESYKLMVDYGIKALGTGILARLCTKFNQQYSPELTSSLDDLIKLGLGCIPALYTGGFIKNLLIHEYSIQKINELKSECEAAQSTLKNYAVHGDLLSFLD